MFTKILNVVQLFTKPTVVTVTVQSAYCCYCSTLVQLPTFGRNSAKTRSFCDFAIFTRFLRDFKPILRRFQANLSVRRIKFKEKQSGLHPVGPTLGNSSQVLAYCCSRGLLFTTVVHQAHCCSVVTVNNKNIVQQLTFGSSTGSPTISAPLASPRYARRRVGRSEDPGSGSAPAGRAGRSVGDA